MRGYVRTAISIEFQCYCMFAYNQTQILIKRLTLNGTYNPCTTECKLSVAECITYSSSTFSKYFNSL